jgi:hypothetical protein
VGPRSTAFNAVEHITEASAIENLELIFLSLAILGLVKLAHRLLDELGKERER